MRNLKTAIVGVVVALVLVSCNDDTTPEPEVAEQYKVVVVNEGAIDDFTQQMYIGVAGFDVLSAEISGAVWDDVTLHEGDESTFTTRYFSRKSDVPSAATYKSSDDLDYLRYVGRIEAKEETESTMRTTVTFYRAGERIGEKNFTISGKGGEFVIDYHDDYNMFEWDNYQPL